MTGAAGFIGSHLVDHLLNGGHEVVGIDAFRPYYSVEEKQRSLEAALGSEQFTLIRSDLLELNLTETFDGTDVLFHLAAQPGVRHSWSDFERYEQDNILATHRVLEAARADRVRRIVFSSSSSVYGNAARFPTTEIDLPAPHSPYGVTKLAAEHLARLFAANWSVPTVCLRYFTVYGPRQRPDMAMRRLIDSAMSGRPFPLFGDGSQIRDFTYVDDVVTATVAAATADVEPGSLFNVSGAEPIAMSTVIAAVGSATGREVAIDAHPPAPGDVMRTGASIERARRILGWEPVVHIADGIGRQASWQASLLQSP